MSTAAAPRDAIIAHVDELLGTGSFRDYCHNGLQVAGRAEVTRIASGVSCSRAFVDAALEAGADLLLTHHGLIWGGTDRIDGLLAGRLRPLMAADANLASWHLPLDAHPMIGNNALLLAGLGAPDTGETFPPEPGRDVGRVGELDAPIGIDALLERLREVLTLPDASDGTPPAPILLGPRPQRITRIAACSGGGGRYAGEAARLGAQVLITGEPTEPSMDEAAEHGVLLIAAGHYATETLGIRALGEQLAGRFGVEHGFIHLPNPV